MALTTTQQKSSAGPKPDRSKPEVFLPPPDVVITPFHPWPRPYFLEDGLRKVAPYHFTYNTYCKARWRGRELIDIFATEFRDRPQAYYVSELPNLSNIPPCLLFKERCHRNRQSHGKRQKSFYQPNCQQWRCHLSHSAPA